MQKPCPLCKGSGKYDDGEKAKIRLDPVPEQGRTIEPRYPALPDLDPRCVISGEVWDGTLELDPCDGSRF